MLSLMEEVLLLSLNEDKGNFSFTASTVMNYCLAGAILMELELHKRIAADKKILSVLDSRSLNNSRLNSALSLLHSGKRQRSPEHWVGKLSGSLKGLRKGLLEEMVDKALVREEEKQFFFFTTTRYPVRDPRTKKDIVERIHRALIRGEKPSQRTARLIGLLYASGLLLYLFDKEDRKEAKRRAKEMSKEDILANAVKKSIQLQNSAGIVAVS
ncbi:Golgi phosphoprotein 3 (GPP34) [Desulfitobacterium dichloroeliminans LMG P-21439]|uniref:Golgi phosphoprotein 3 (GPP34) n=1 Tax=Desulfitobacterium dichloroeliminans (strain LMG P-21439 / DCA1) TaxID=871963 RepID=L0F642_DESDL|nr:GPP34 family phosphoprotein [Desulfitobacterium dichloroeliminans]AGA68106.1 Golgi phosphoprotein 3 (GPP34) [Desulfitobacterium dichloroeliminans LMG P-21439]